MVFCITSTNKKQQQQRLVLYFLGGICFTIREESVSVFAISFSLLEEDYCDALDYDVDGVGDEDDAPESSSIWPWRVPLVLLAHLGNLFVLFLPLLLLLRDDLDVE